MDEALITRLRQRLGEDKASTDLPIQPPTLPRPPLAEPDIQRAEQELGFTLPKIVRLLYLHVGDGGYGPGYGIYPLLDTGSSMVEIYRACMEANRESDSFEQWPAQVLEFCGWGCNAFSAIDCSHPTCPVVRFDPDRWTEEKGIAGCLVPESDSLSEWLTAWLDGEQLWKRVRRGG